MNEIMHAVTEHCRRFPKAFQMSRLACCLSVALFSIFGFFVCLQRYYPILIIDRKYWTNTASAANIFSSSTNKLINKISETNTGANGHRKDHTPLIPNYRIDLVYYSENNSTILYAFVASLWCCLTLFFAFLLSLANDIAYEWRIFHRRRKPHECLAILSLVFCFQTYAGLIINVALELMVASEIRKISNNNQRPTIFLNLHILCGLLVMHVWHIILKTVHRIHCQEEIRQRAGVVKMLISGA